MSFIRALQLAIVFAFVFSVALSATLWYGIKLGREIPIHHSVAPKQSDDSTHTLAKPKGWAADI